MAVLSKLLKYDFRANLKIFLFIWPAILVFGLLERVEGNLRSELAARGRSASLPGEEYRRPEGEEGRRA